MFTSLVGKWTLYVIIAAMVVASIVLGIKTIYNYGVKAGRNEVVSSQVVELTKQLRERDAALTIARKNVNALEVARVQALEEKRRIKNELDELGTDRPQLDADRLQLLREYSDALPGGN